jgi:hypothetical protein
VTIRFQTAPARHLRSTGAPAPSRRPDASKAPPPAPSSPKSDPVPSSPTLVSTPIKSPSLSSSRFAPHQNARPPLAPASSATRAAVAPGCPDRSKEEDRVILHLTPCVPLKLLEHGVCLRSLQITPLY